MHFTSLLLILGLSTLISCGPEAVAKRRAGLAPYSTKGPGAFQLERPHRQAQEEEH